MLRIRALDASKPNGIGTLLRSPSMGTPAADRAAVDFALAAPKPSVRAPKLATRYSGRVRKGKWGDYSQCVLRRARPTLHPAVGSSEEPLSDPHLDSTTSSAFLGVCTKLMKGVRVRLDRGVGDDQADRERETRRAWYQERRARLRCESGF